MWYAQRYGKINWRILKVLCGRKSSGSTGIPKGDVPWQGSEKGQMLPHWTRQSKWRNTSRPCEVTRADAANAERVWECQAICGLVMHIQHIYIIYTHIYMFTKWLIASFCWGQSLINQADGGCPWIREYVCICIYILYLIYLSIDPSIHPSVHPSIYPCIHASIYIYNYMREYIYIEKYRHKNKYK